MDSSSQQQRGDRKKDNHEEIKLRKVFVVPKWRKEIPPTSYFTDVSKSLEFDEICKNYLWDHGYSMVDSEGNCDEAEKKRLSLGWNGSSCSLSCFSNGRIWFPPTKWEEFLYYYSLDFARGNKCLRYNQIIPADTTIVHFILDCDLEGDKIESWSFLLKMCRCIQKVVDRYTNSSCLDNKHDEEEEEDEEDEERIITITTETETKERRMRKRKRKMPLMICTSKARRIDRWGKLKFCEHARKLRDVRHMDGSLFLDSEAMIQQLIQLKDIREEEKRVRMGVHIHGYDMVVKRSDAKQFKLSVVAQLEEDMGIREEGKNSWQDVIDIGPWCNGQLRMLGSKKLQDCAFCEEMKKKQNDCPICFGYGKVDNDRIYELKTVLLDGVEQLDILQHFKEDVFELIKASSIYVEGSGLGHLTTQEEEQQFCTSWQISAEEPLYLEQQQKDVFMKVTYSDGEKEKILVSLDQFSSSSSIIPPPNKDDVVSILDVNGNEVGSKKRERRIFLKVGEERWNIIEDVLRNHAWHEYAKVKVRNIYTNMKNSFYVVHLKPTMGCRYCHHVQRSHESQNIYFFFGFNPQTKNHQIFQKCYDKDSCLMYQSDGLNIPWIQSQILFPPRTIHHHNTTTMMIANTNSNPTNTTTTTTLKTNPSNQSSSSSNTLKSSSSSNSLNSSNSSSSSNSTNVNVKKNHLGMKKKCKSNLSIFSLDGDHERYKREGDYQ
jgi:predicted transport protein